ncbi:uncharacterized protein LOC128238347 [Mya arenaria]|uniref:uncharacterized protein LOC128238347 n=1 Tax=Mya arenaria TaxID=6604 RepID=UPI0022E95651|nr:uncharacterized protein LOC128238347 [Mya arenaria]XP_052810141.1 uncharacterized protein LOC128238347 [Mya arenaria]XP_052810142.1 uncharacterized protein LOC128238347 [Mya arenaria]
MFILVINAYLIIIAQGEKAHLSNYANAKVSCQNRGGLITQELLKFNELINITCELGEYNNLLTDGESVWVQGQAQTGPYIALYTCMRFSNQNKHMFVRIRTLHSNILFECSVFCDHILHSTGYLGIYKDSCLCMSDSFRFPHTPECLEHDFLDIHKRIIVFRLMGKLLFKAQSKSANFNCLGASFQESGKTSYFNTKCSSTLYSICTQRVDSDLSSECKPRVDELCFNEEKNTFFEHYRNCWQYNGTLIPFNSGITESLNYSVMLGSFRAFKAIENDGENNGNVTWSCLSITRFSGTIYMETENCSNENTFICMDDIRNASNQAESETTGGTTKHVVPISTTITTTTTTTTTNIIIIIICLVSLILVTVVALIVRCKCTRLRKYTGPKTETIQEETQLNAFNSEMQNDLTTKAECNQSQCVPEAQQSGKKPDATELMMITVFY